MAAPLLLAALGYGIYNKYQKEKVLEDAMKDPTKTFGQKLSAVLETNPEMRDWPMVQRMMESNNAVEAQLMQEETTRKKALWDETFKQVPAQSQEAFLRANPEEAAAFAPERYKVLTAKDKDAADLKLWTDKAGITDQFTDENRIQQQVVTQQNAAYSAGLQRETAAINRQAELDAKIAAGEPITQADKDAAALALEATKQKQKLKITGDAKAAEEAQQFDSTTTEKARLVQDLIDTRNAYTENMVSGPEEVQQYETKRRALITMEALAASGGKAEPNPSVIARLEEKYPPLGTINIRNKTAGMTEELRSINSARLAKGFKPLKLKALEADLPAGFEVD